MGIVSDDILKRIDKAPVGLLIFSGAFEILFVSDTFKKLAEHYHFKYPQDNLNRELLDLEPLREDLNYLTLGYSFEKEIKSLITPGTAKISLIVRGIPFYEGDKFAGGLLTAEDFRLSAGEDFFSDSMRLQEIVKTSADYLFITDKNRSIRFSTGRKNTSGTVYNNILDIIPENRKNELIENFRKAASTRMLQNFLTMIITDQEEYECRIEPLLNKEGIADYYLFTFNQVGQIARELEQMKSDLKNAEKFRSSADHSDTMIYIYDGDFKLLYSNRKAEELPDPAEFLGKATIKTKLNNHPKCTIEFEHGSRTYSAVFTYTGESQISCYCREKTTEAGELKRLKEAEEVFRRTIASAGVFIINTDPSGKIIFTNRYFLEHFDTAQNSFYDIIDKYLHPEFVIPRERKESVRLNLVSHGTVKEYSCSFTPVNGPDNQIEYITVAGTDVSLITEEQREKLLFREIFNNAGDGIAVIKNSRVYIANDSFAYLFGYNNADEITGISTDALSFLEDKRRIFEQLNELDTTERFEFSGKKKNGSEFFVSASLSPFNTGSSYYTVMICRDVTERRRIQSAIRESEERFRNLTRSIDDFLFMYEKIEGRQRPVFYTESVTKITGYDPEDFLSDTRLMLKIVHPDDLPEVKKKLKTLFRSRIQVSDELEFRIINRNGNIVWVRNKINLVRNGNSSIQKIYGLVSDITLRKKTEDELKRSTENLVKLNDAKDRVISVISHDLRTPFSSILGFTDLLLTDDELSEEEQKQYVKYIQESSKSMLSLVNSLLDWTRIQTGRIRFEPEKFTAATVIDEAVQVLSGSAFQKHIDLENNVDREAVIFADKSLLLQAFSNLISNAIKFTRIGGRISITASPSEKLRFMQFCVSDNGIGIQEENLKNLFRVETKFSTEGTAGEKGSGLGLSLVKEIIEKHGGTIWAESVYQKGTDFKFTIPVSPSNILLVDDSNTDRLLYSKLLKNFAPDYNIETAPNGKEALDKIIKSAPALIITDHVMPEMNGYEMVLQLNRSRLPEIPPVIILSSELDRNIIAAYNDAGIEYIFQKPVNLSEFKQTVEKLLRKGYLRR